MGTPAPPIDGARRPTASTASTGQLLSGLEDAATLLVATLGHELRTPLTVISGCAQLLITGRLTEAEQREAADAIARQADTLAATIERVMLGTSVALGVAPRPADPGRDVPDPGVSPGR